MSKQSQSGIYAQFGAGHSGPSEWLNFDASPTLKLERLPVVGRFVRKNKQSFPKTVRYGDIVAGLPLSPASCRGLYGSHVLEHLALQELRAALRNCHALLEEDGVLRVIVPDLEGSIKRYLANATYTAASDFLRETMLGVEVRRRGGVGRLVDAMGNSRHLWMWDEKGLMRELADAGFKKIRRCACGDAADPMFRFVEDPDRFDHALALEAAK